MKRLLPAAAFALWAASLSMSGSAADSLESLRRKQSALEQELERVRAQISALEANPGDAGKSPPPTTWYIKSFAIDEVNSAGGVEPYAVLINPNASSPIKYLHITARLYNAVGDVVSSTIGGATSARLQFTGPLLSSEGEKRVDWGPIWYNSTGKCLKIDSIQVTFVNGKILAFAGKNLKAALASDLVNECKLTTQ